MRPAILTSLAHAFDCLGPASQSRDSPAAQNPPDPDNKDS